VSPPDPYYGYEDEEYAESLESNRLNSAAARFEELADYIEGLRGDSTAVSELAARLDVGGGAVRTRGELLHREGLRLWGSPSAGSEATLGRPAIKHFFDRYIEALGE